MVQKDEKKSEIILRVNWFIFLASEIRENTYFRGNNTQR